eukprot:2358703-Pleurochrysis_carterae.AAC.1
MAIDLALGRTDHDVLREDVASRLLGWVGEGRFGAVFLAPPCSSFSVAHQPGLRTREEPEGAQPVPEEWARYLRKHNALANFAARMVAAAGAADTPWALENPADYGDREGVAWWERFADRAP